MTDVKTAAGAIKERIDELGWSKAEAGRLTGMSFKTLDQVMSDGYVPVRQDKRRALAVALGWPPDAIDRLEAGESPDDFTDSRPDVIEAINADPRLTPASRSMLVAAYQAAVRGR